MSIRSLEDKYTCVAVRRVARKIEDVFTSLEHIPFLRKNDRSEFRYFRRLFLSACMSLDRRVVGGEIKPWSKREIQILVESARAHYPPNGRNGEGKPAEKHAPHCHLLARRAVRIGVFIGSFDPFQMTHLETAFRFLSRSKHPADLVLAIPEGAYSSLKPGRSDYGYRYDILQRQVREAFRPFIVPLDIGEGEDTIGIVRRIIALFTGYPVSITHILGSDVFPLAAKWYEADMGVWMPEARKRQVDLEFGTFVVKRSAEDDITALVRGTRKQGIPVQVDTKPIGTPSSTDLREQAIFTIIFPTAEVIEKLEVVFRYGMHHHWLTEVGNPEYQI